MNDNVGSTKEIFDNEAASVKIIISEMISAGNFEVAQQLLEQYALINPADPEINEIRKVLYPEDIENTENNSIPEAFGVLKDIETIFVLNRIIFGRIGIQDTVLRKVKLMEDVWNYRPLILTCYHNINQRQAHMWLQTSGDGKVTMSANTRLLNVYEYFQKSYAEGLENKAVYKKADDGKHYIETGENIYDVFDGDTLVRQEYYTGYVGSLRMVRTYERGKKINDHIYDDWGYLNCIREYDPTDDNIYSVKYYTTDGLLCLEAFYDHLNEERDEPDKLVVYNDYGSIVKTCANRSELASLCLESIMPEDKFCIIFIEDGLLSKTATALSINKTKRAICEIVHNVFLRDPYNLESEPQRFYKNLCENNSAFDGIVLLTEAAKKDFQYLYGDKQNIFAIPHFYPFIVDKVDFNSRDHNKAVIVARLDPIKQLENAIYIFSLVVKEVPDARLEIYGRGDEEKVLKELIYKLRMQNNIFLMGLTDDPVSVLQTASLFIMTSLVEGYPSTLFESICNGCPAFSYDIKYGPSEIIIDEKTGFLFHRSDRESFSKKIITYLNDVELQRAMIENCYNDAPRFSPERFMDRWYDMTKTLYERRKI